MKKALITGGTGFIGRHLIPQLEQDGYQVIIKTRTPEKYQQDFFFRDSKFIKDLEEVESANIVINLAGENLAGKRWSKKQKKVIYNSRVTITNDLVKWMAKLEKKPEVFISSSAIGFYGARKDEEITEQSAAGAEEEFQSKLCRDWEFIANQALKYDIRTAIIRTGVVLGDDGALPTMLKPFKIGLGGRLGTGKQWFSWIHIKDHVNAMLHLIRSSNLSGAYNLTSPNPVTNATLTQNIADHLGKKVGLAVPAFALKASVGEFSELLLTGQKVIPEALLESGFQFDFPEISDALADLV